MKSLTLTIAAIVLPVFSVFADVPYSSKQWRVTLPAL